ncbi:MAG: TRAP transporter small permease [Woeseia sp.]
MAAEGSSGLPDRLGRLGAAIENALLVLLLGIMMVLAVGQIVLRLFFDSGFIWADEMLKILVLWIALIASVAASRSRRHLRIDVLSRYVPEKYSRFPAMVVDAFAASMCGIIAWHSSRYVLLTLEFNETVLLGIPSWLVQGIVPLAFALMCYRFTLHFLAGVLGLFGASRPGRRE